MPINTEHPDYVERTPDWTLMRDCYAGERRIKSKTFTYLPATGGMVEDGAMRGADPGYSAYIAYLTRAVFPDSVDDATKILVGAMHRKPAKIELPEALEEMRGLATREGDTLEGLLRKINEEQLLVGRVGLLADVSPSRNVPHLVQYPAESIINWDDRNPDVFGVDKLQLVVLREEIQRRTDVFEWENVTQYRVCLLEQQFEGGEPVGTSRLYTTFTETDGAMPVATDAITPVYKGTPLDEIPFVFIGSNDLSSKPDEIPLLGLARYTLTTYRGEADYRQTLFMLGQDTLVIIGEDSGSEDEDAGVTKSTRTGAGAKISLPAVPGADAKFIGINRDGLSEQRVALQNDHTRLREMGSRLLEPRSGTAESGEALKVRVAAQTSTLLQIAMTAAAGLESILKICAKWVGADPEQVKVIPNLDFAETKARPADLRDLLDARERGAPLSLESIHQWAKQNGFTDAEFEAEVAQIKTEQELMDLLKPTPEAPEQGAPADDAEDTSEEESDTPAE